MRTVRLTLSAVVLAAVCAPAAASAGNQCKPWMYYEQVGPAEVPIVTIVC